MNTLANTDLNQFRLDIDSWLGRAVAVGVESEKLPENFKAALMAFLRIHSLSFAQKQRSGIALGTDQLRRGMEMGLSCIDLALEEQGVDDLNRAVDVLAAGEFAELYKRGWEMAFARMETMRAKAELLGKRPHLAFFARHRDRIGTLAQLVPETWTSADREGELVEVDLRADWQMIAAVAGRVDFLRILPDEAFAALWGKRGVDFAQVLRRIALALALERRELGVDAEVVAVFGSTCFADGIWLPAAKESVLNQVTTQLQTQPLAADIAREIKRELNEEIAVLESAVAGGFLAELFIAADADKETERWDPEAEEDMAADMGWDEYD